MYAVEMRGITKRFPGMIANDRLNFLWKRERFIVCLEKMVQEKLH